MDHGIILPLRDKQGFGAGNSGEVGEVTYLVQL